MQIRPALCALATAGSMAIAAALPAESQTLRDCAQCPELVIIPAGTFAMGSPASEERRSGSEGPQHTVKLPSFAAGKYEVTFAEWDACVTAGGCGGYTPKDRDWGRDRNPVIMVSWEDAQKYVAWLSAKTGKTYRLLSEAEWEYAARGKMEGGPNEPAFWWGGSVSSAQANYDATAIYAGGVTGEYRKKTIPVGSFLPNPFGLHDVHGNASEWVQDCYSNNYLKMPVRGAPPENGSAWQWKDCRERVIRGGSYFNSPPGIRAAARDLSDPGVRQPNIGFRVARNK